VGCNIVLMKHSLPLLILTGLLFGQDTTLVLIDGSTVSGTIISETDSTYRIMGESWRVTDGVYEVFNTFINISKNETVGEAEAQIQCKYHVPTIQLLKFNAGEAQGSYEIRFCHYNHEGRFQRSPLILDVEDLPRLKQALQHTPKLKKLLNQMV